MMGPKLYDTSADADYDLWMLLEPADADYDSWMLLEPKEAEGE